MHKLAVLMGWAKDDRASTEHQDSLHAAAAREQPILLGAIEFATLLLPLAPKRCLIFYSVYIHPYLDKSPTSF
jgi:hypothetical protein